MGPVGAFWAGMRNHFREIPPDLYTYLKTILDYYYHDKIESLISRNHKNLLIIHGKCSKSQVPLLDICIYLTIKAREGKMSDVPLRNIKNNMQYQFIRNRLEKLMPWISGSYIPFRKSSEDPPHPKLENLKL